MGDNVQKQKILLEKVKVYLRIDDNYEDDFLGSLILSSIEYIKNAGVNFDESSELHKLCLSMIVCNWYEYRGVTPDIPIGAKNIISQLQYNYED